MKTFLMINSVLILTVSLAIGQNNWKSGFYNTVNDFKEQRPSFPCSFEPKPYPVILKDTFLLPNLFRLIPKETPISYSHFKASSILAYDGENLFLNVKLLRMADGFVKVGMPEAYLLFIGRTQVNIHENVNSIYRSDQSNKDRDLLLLKPFVFDMNIGRVHPFTPSTLERLLEPYPEILQLYGKDPNWKNPETMKVYLEILNDLIKTEKQ